MNFWMSFMLCIGDPKAWASAEPRVIKPSAAKSSIAEPDIKALKIKKLILLDDITFVLLKNMLSISLFGLLNSRKLINLGDADFNIEQ